MAKATAPKAAAKAAPASKGQTASTKQHTHKAGSAVGKHTTTAQRQGKLAITARSLRGINRNLRLQGVQATVAIVKGKGIMATKAGTKTAKPVMVSGKQPKAVRNLTYGQWVTAVAATLKIKVA